MNQLSHKSPALHNKSQAVVSTEPDERSHAVKQLQRRNSQQKVTLYLRQLGRKSIAGAFDRRKNSSSSVGSVTQSYH